MGIRGEVRDAFQFAFSRWLIEDGLVYRAAGVDGGISWPDGAPGGETGINIIPYRPVVMWMLLGGV